LQKVINSDDLHFDADRFLTRLIEVNALRLGARIQCPVCTRHNWYELNALEYQLKCRFCLSDYPAPVQSPKEILWTYRAHGPFANSVAQGAFSVLFTLNCLSGRHERGVTPLFSYTARKGSQELEADLTCLYRQSAWAVRRTDIVHAECKSFGGFQAKDFQRMKALAREFPGSALVFATLADSLGSASTRAIRSIALAERKKRLNQQVWNRVIVLTGTELFSTDRIPRCWEGKSGLFDTLSKTHQDYSDLASLADATQQLYLGMPAWHEWSEAEWKKKHDARAGRKHRGTATSA
jgi:hypothetical protein